MAKRLLTDKLINKNEIKEELRKIKNSVNAYVTPSGKIYLDYGENNLYPVKLTKTAYGYLQCGIRYEGKQCNTTKKVHRLVAEAYLDNPDNLPTVDHINTIKTDNRVENLQWLSISQNTKKAFDDGYEQDKSWDDSQSIAVCKFDLEGNYIEEYGSVGEAARQTGMTKTGILHQCNHKCTSKPRKGYYYRYKNEYDEKGFVL